MLLRCHLLLEEVQQSGIKNLCARDVPPGSDYHDDDDDDDDAIRLIKKLSAQLKNLHQSESGKLSCKQGWFNVLRR